MRIVALLTLLSISPLMGMFRGSKNFLPIVVLHAKQIYPKNQKHLPPRLQETAIKHHAEMTKINAQKSKTHNLQQQKEKPKNND